MNTLAMEADLVIPAWVLWVVAGVVIIVGLVVMAVKGGWMKAGK